jgi:uncharacterized protein YbaA (DUF1428 family)
MAKYVDGYVFVVPNDKVEDYIKMAEEGARLWKKLGALEYFECRGDDLIPKSMGGQSQLGFTALTKAKPNETVWFSFIVYKSKEHRDEVNAKMEKEMEKVMEKYKDVPMPFEMERMANGGFNVIVEG